MCALLIESKKIWAYSKGLKFLKGGFNWKIFQFKSLQGFTKNKSSLRHKQFAAFFSNLHLAQYALSFHPNLSNNFFWRI